MSIYLVVSIIVLLCALACYAFISQSIEKKRIQKQRILMALKTKHRNFVHMINGFPPNFLNNELLGLVYRSLIDTCDQLSKLEPEQGRHLDDVTLYSNQLAALAKNDNTQKARLDNPQQMKDIRQHLQELQRFILQQESVKSINKVQAQSYLDQIKRTNLQMSVDTYIYHAKQSQQSGKIRLALHYFALAKKLLTAENAARTFDKQIAQLASVIEKLEEKVQLSNDQSAETASPVNEAAAKEWESFNKPEENWKKKNVYD